MIRTLLTTTKHRNSWGQRDPSRELLVRSRRKSCAWQKGLLKRLGGNMGGFSAGDFQVILTRRVTAVLGATEHLDPPSHNLHGHDSVYNASHTCLPP